MRVDGTVSTVSFPNAYDPEADPQQLTWPSVRFPWGQRFYAALAARALLGEFARALITISLLPVGVGMSPGFSTFWPPDSFAQYPRCGTGMPARRHAFARPTSVTPYVSANVAIGCDQTRS